MACLKQAFFITGKCKTYSCVEQGCDFGRESIVERIEIDWHFIAVEVEIGKSLTCVEELFAYTSNSFHIHFNLYAETLTEYVYKFNGWSCRASSKPPNVGVKDVDSVDDCHES